MQFTLLPDHVAKDLLQTDAMGAVKTMQAAEKTALNVTLC